MGNFDDFDLDIKKIKNKGSDAKAAVSGKFCDYISSKVVDTVIKTYIKSFKQCSEKGCKVPSRDYNHPSCRKLNKGTIQIQC